LIQADHQTLRLAELLAGSPRVGIQKLHAGVAAERERLGARPWLLMSWRSSYDIDGLTEYLQLVDSFDTLEDAKRAADAQAAKILIEFGRPDTGRPYMDPWKRNPERALNGPLRGPTLQKSSTITCHYQTGFAFWRGSYDREYPSLLVLGPFSAFIVAGELLAVIGESHRHELRTHFDQAASGPVA
jgi:hypothetical protein